MLDADRLKLAIEIHSQSYKLLRWVGTSIEKGNIIPIVRVQRHSDTPEAAFDWIERVRPQMPIEIQPNPARVREFANFFWTYVTTSFDVIDNPGKRLVPGTCGCTCPMCARIENAPHLQPKKLTKHDKLRAGELMIERVGALATEEQLPVSPEQCSAIVEEEELRRCAAFSAYGFWLIQCLSGKIDGPAVLALWREIAWTKLGSPIQGFKLRYKDFAIAEEQLLNAMKTS